MSSRLDFFVKKRICTMDSMAKLTVEGSKVLIVEDDGFLEEIYRVKLHMAGYCVVTVSNGPDALHIIPAERPDVIILDILLPLLNGLEVLKMLKSDVHTKHIPVIVLSNLQEENIITESYEYGAVDYIIKANCTPQFVEQRIREILITTRIRQKEGLLDCDIQIDQRIERTSLPVLVKPGVLSP
jgi:PleD family two-component response regulator